MRKFSPFLLAAGAALLTNVALEAKQGAPHSIIVEPNYSNVVIGWSSPEAPKQLKWHDDNDYDGDTGRQISPQRPASLYIASDFSAADLKQHVGEKIVSVDYFEYRPTLKVTAILYEDGKIVREADFDLTTPTYKANSTRTVAFAEPYVIPEGKNIRVALRIEHGSNFDFVAIMNNKVNPKGDLISYDGKTWMHNGRGTYLITANIYNDVDEAPKGFNVYADGKKMNSELITDPWAELNSQPNGKHNYKVEAVYADANYSSADTEVDIKGTDLYFPTPATLDIVTDGVSGLLEWTSPLLRGAGNDLSWTNGTYGNSIGGTASSNTKVWIKNDFSAADLLSFKNANITAINAQFHESVMSQMIIFVMKDGAFVQYDTIAPERVKEIGVDKWERFPFSKPVKIEEGSKYTVGYYMMHTPKAHPVSVDTGTAVGSKANSFSTSSPNSKDFANSKPSWKTLASGNISGNWLMKTEVEGGDAFSSTLTGYNVYRNGELIKEGLTKAEFEDEVPSPGTYTYGVQAVGTEGKSSALLEKSASFKLPDSYRAPLISEAKLDKESGVASIEWGMDVDLSHHGAAAYKVGFDEEMTLAYGSKFTAAELADYQGYYINKLKFIIGEAIPAGFKLEIYNGEGKVLSSTEIKPDAVTPLGMYSLSLDSAVLITGKEDLILAYNATLPAKASAMVLDGGPLVAGGAVVKLPGMSNWLNLGTINATYNNYNIVISAVASETASAEAPGKSITLGETDTDFLSNVTLSASALREANAVSALSASPAKAKRKTLNPIKFNIYRNNELVGEATGRKFTETLPGYDTYTYAVTAIYPNGWESGKSDPAILSHAIAQLDRAPYDLRVNDAHNGLVWQAAEEAPVITYATPGASYGVGMTGTGQRETFAVQKFPADSIKNLVGNKITHIKFALYSTELNSASVVIFKNLGIAYEQEIPLSSLVTISDTLSNGYNTIRLNEPFEIAEGDEIMIGYHITYANGIKPMIFDAGPATDGFGNLLSASAGATSWKTLKSLNKSLDGNWRIYAFVETPKNGLTKAPKAQEEITYNVYRDDKLIASGIKAKSFEQEGELTNGTYTVSAQKGDAESARSNECYYGLNAVDEIMAASGVRYDAASATLIVPAGAAGSLYDAAGNKLAEISGNYSMQKAARGLYIFVAADGKALKFVR